MSMVEAIEALKSGNATEILRGLSKVRIRRLASELGLDVPAATWRQKKNDAVSVVVRALKALKKEEDKKMNFKEIVGKLGSISGVDKLGRSWSLIGEVEAGENPDINIWIHFKREKGLLGYKRYIGRVRNDERLRLADQVGTCTAMLYCDEYALWDKIPQALWGKSHEQIMIEEEITEIRKEMAWRKKEGAPQIETKAQASKLNRGIRHFLQDEEREWEFRPLHSVEELHELEARLAELKAV